jgi:RNA polymerase sigma-B factor
VRLAVRAGAGDPDAAAELVVLLEPLIGGLARRFEGRAARADLEQAGRVGVLEAARRFDPAISVNFEAYASRYVIGEMVAVTHAATAPLRIPRPAREARAVVERAVEELGDALGRSPSVAELGAATGLDDDAVIDALNMRTVEQPLPAEDLEHALPGHTDPIGDATDRLALAGLLEGVDQRSAAIVRLRFEHGLSQREIGDRLGISQMHVSRLLRAALAQLRDREL